MRKVSYCHHCGKKIKIDITVYTLFLENPNLLCRKCFQKQFGRSYKELKKRMDELKSGFRGKELINMEPVDKELKNAIGTLETIEESIQKSELEKRKIIDHLNYLYKEYYTATKNIEKRKNNI